MEENLLDNIYELMNAIVKKDKKVNWANLEHQDSHGNNSQYTDKTEQNRNADSRKGFLTDDCCNGPENNPEKEDSYAEQR